MHLEASVVLQENDEVVWRLPSEQFTVKRRTRDAGNPKDKMALNITMVLGGACSGTRRASTEEGWELGSFGTAQKQLLA